MKISYNWLKEYVDITVLPHELADKLTMAGLEVESIAELGKDIKGVVVAEILSKEKHPNADRLSFCKVKTDKGIHEIVCGANNMKAGDFVALALPGAALPKGIKIEKTKIRGVASEGMLCSEVELGFKDTSDGIMLLQKDLTLGEDITKALGIKDFILDVNVTPNRPDCLSIIGIAREAAAALNKQLRVASLPLQAVSRGCELREIDKPIKDLVSVEIDEPDLCHRYTARVIEDVTVKESPDWLKKRLINLGIRPINNIVDITNYVMLEHGQPLHAFDYDKISDKKIVVRKSKKSEEITTLDGVKRILDEGVLVIADAKTPVAIAGIIGGEETGVTIDTKDVLLESAYFTPLNIRKTSKTIELKTESSYRFERGLDIQCVAKALDRAAELIADIAKGKAARGFIDEYPAPSKSHSIALHYARVNRILGTSLNNKEIEDYLARLGFSFNVSEKIEGAVAVVVPSFRVDISMEIDLIEEIARLNGYENISTTIPASQLLSAVKTNKTVVTKGVRDFLSSIGFCEVINYSFISPLLAADISGESEVKDNLRLLNPLSEEWSVMRKTLVCGLLSNLRYNLNHGNDNLRLFEIGCGFIPKGSVYNEKNLAAGLISGLRMSEKSIMWDKEDADFFDIKGVIESLFSSISIQGVKFTTGNNISFLHPGKSCAISVNGADVGIMGEIHPDILERLDLKQSAYIFEIDIDSITNISGRPSAFREIPRYPSVVRDAAFIIDRAVLFAELVNAIEILNIKLIEDTGVFDVYYGESIPPDKKSIAIRLTYRSDVKTLTDEDVNMVHNNVVNEIVRRFNAEIRGI
ncbi:MAG: phenylalanine--tRNA ligase subunit beta [Deltaproteobacteria bacterium]|nr:phenylalanine--tRNA ligase subunit beta [Deltaproteobacteria bacterium]